MPPSAPIAKSTRPPKWIKPQLTRLVDEAPSGHGWLHEIKCDGYRMHARIEGRDIKLLTRTGLNRSHRCRRTIEALGSLKVKSAYLDGELCALDGAGVLVFSRLQAQAALISSYSLISIFCTPNSASIDEALTLSSFCCREGD